MAGRPSAKKTVGGISTLGGGLDNMTLKWASNAERLELSADPADNPTLTS